MHLVRDWGCSPQMALYTAVFWWGVIYAYGPLPVQTCQQRPALHRPPCLQRRIMLRQSMIITSQQCPAHDRLTYMRTRSTTAADQSSMTTTGFSMTLNPLPDRQAPDTRQKLPMENRKVQNVLRA